jgi:predicted pyridoxine 5'-phosphate oxidase superfamily flavin-nucleotide-binding protein
VTTPFHEGEIAVQTRAGARAMAEKVGNGIHPTMPNAARDFLARQPMIFLGAADQSGRVWATILTGAPGFAQATNAVTVALAAQPSSTDPLGEAFAGGPAPVGLLAIEPETRRRMRINGLGEAQPGGISVRAQQVYANCPKYIQARTIEPAVSQPHPGLASHMSSLTETQQQRVARADTFFLASVAGEGADVSHRGGPPSFIRVDSPTRLTWPDYSGNLMFNTLGNLAADGRAGLLFLDFETGTTLQMTGRAEIIWDIDQAVVFPSAERLVTFTLEEAIETVGAVPLCLRFVSASPFNPSVGGYNKDQEPTRDYDSSD